MFLLYDYNNQITFDEVLGFHDQLADSHGTVFWKYSSIRDTNRELAFFLRWKKQYLSAIADWNPPVFFVSAGATCRGGHEQTHWRQQYGFRPRGGGRDHFMDEEKITGRGMDEDFLPNPKSERTQTLLSQILL